jgi:hypothetical protein
MSDVFIKYICVIALSVATFLIGYDLSAQEPIPAVSENSFFSERFSTFSIETDHPRQPQKKSVTRAVLYSLLLPGTGEWYAGNSSTAKYLFGGEVTLWLSLYGFHSYGTWLRNDARSFAEVYAGIDWAGKDDKFFVNVGNFTSREEYNEKKMRDRDVGALYLDSSYDWNWESEELRAEYRDLRVRSDQMFNAIKFVGTAIVANHIVSAIIAGNSASRYNERLGQTDWSFGIIPLHNGFIAGIQHTF